MLIVELNGAPGCGKSTLCNQVLGELQSRGYLAGTLQDVVFRKQRNKMTNYIQMLFILFSVKRYKLNYAVAKLARDYGLERGRVLFALRFLKFLSKLESTLKDEKFDLLLLDEGIVQYLTSIPHDKEIKQNTHYEKVCEMVQTLYNRVIQVNCHIEFEENVRRAKQRGQVNSRFDHLPEEQLRKALSVKRYNIDLVRKRLAARKIVNINMTEDIQISSVHLTNVILEELENREKVK